jgi:hypothetical protein
VGCQQLGASKKQEEGRPSGVSAILFETSIPYFENRIFVCGSVFYVFIFILCFNVRKLYSTLTFFHTRHFTMPRQKKQKSYNPPSMSWCSFCSRHPHHDALSMFSGTLSCQPQ